MSNPDPAPGGGQLLPIGAVAELTGKRSSSIRYYEQIGLLPQPVRVSGRRMYGQATVRTLAMIETGQRAGLTLDEIKTLLSAPPGNRAATERLRELADRKLPEITALIERSALVRDWLECAARCECPDLDECPLFGEPSPLPHPAGQWSASVVTDSRTGSPDGGQVRQGARTVSVRALITDTVPRASETEPELATKTVPVFGITASPSAAVPTPTVAITESDCPLITHKLVPCGLVT